MTCRERYKHDYPGDPEIWDGMCPDDYGYLPKPGYCYKDGTARRCEECWNREILGTNSKIDKVTIVTRDVNGKREVYEYDSWDAVDVTGKDESEQILLILVGDVCVYSKLAHTWITWEVVREFFA